MASLSLRHVYKRYPGGVTAVSDFNLEIKDKDNIELTSGDTSEMVLYQDGEDLSQRMATLKSTNNTLSLPSWFSAGSYQVYVKVIMEATGFAHEAWLDLTIN